MPGTRATKSSAEFGALTSLCTGAGFFFAGPPFGRAENTPHEPVPEEGVYLTSIVAEERKILVLANKPRISKRKHKDM